ncbi:MAG: TRZ/ATZ family hydrolase [Congregibacter sp.]
MTEKHGGSSADLILVPQWLIPIEPSATVLRDHALAIRDGRIVGIFPDSELPSWSARSIKHLPGQVVLPGLVNSHGHAAMSLLRGYADDLPLMPWLEEHIWPAEQSWVSEQFVRDGSALAMAEMVQRGTTTFTDMYFFPGVVGGLCLETGLRAQLAAPIFDFPSAYGSGADDYISKALALRDTYKNTPLVQVAFGPHAPYTVSHPNLEKIATFAAELDMPVHIHLHETAAEVLQAVEAHGERPLDTLHQIGLLGPRTQCVHMTDLGDQDIQTLATTSAHVVHCPHSNMKLASGTCPTEKLVAAGVNVALGTDGAASNNSLNLFGEMRSAAFLAKLSTGDPAAMPAERVLHMATLGGAEALGMDAEIGSLRIGKQADIIAVDLSGPGTQPVHNPISQLVYATTGAEVTHSWVAGKPLLEDRRLLTIDLPDCLARAEHWAAKIRS